jgi:hypothetical protein
VDLSWIRSKRLWLLPGLLTLFSIFLHPVVISLSGIQPDLAIFGIYLQIAYYWPVLIVSVVAGVFTGFYSFFETEIKNPALRGLAYLSMGVCGLVSAYFLGILLLGLANRLFGD